MKKVYASWPQVVLTLGVSALTLTYLWMEGSFSWLAAGVLLLVSGYVLGSALRLFPLYLVSEEKR